MQKLALFILAAMFLFSAEALAKKPKAKAPEIKRGTITGFVASRELRVVNLEPIEIGYRKWVYGDTCMAQPGADMEVLGTEGGKVLLFYVPLGESTLTCPYGTMFLMSTREFLRLQSLYKKNRAAIWAERNLVSGILQKRRMQDEQGR